MFPYNDVEGHRMATVCGKNLNDVLPEIYSSIIQAGKETSPRGKTVKEWSSPVSIELTEHSSPWTLVKGRRLNPYFAVAEVMWILSGRNDVNYISYFNKNIKNFSDDGVTFNGAYGSRIRDFPVYIPTSDSLYYLDSFDQLTFVIRRLQDDKFTRQAVICFWNPAIDLKDGSKDYPCNNIVYLKNRDDHLDVSVVRRSNDAIWGLPYNQIQFYFLQALIAGTLDLKMGQYFEFVQNMHIYKDSYPDVYSLIEKKIQNNQLNEQSYSTLLDRRITLKQFDILASLYFSKHMYFTNFPHEFSAEVFEELRLNATESGVPSYWVDNIIAVALSYIARKSCNYALHDYLINNVEPDIKWLIEDFNNKSKEEL